MIEIDVSPEVEFMAYVLPHASSVERRVRVALHLCLERAKTVSGLLRSLDELSVYLMSHGDDEAGNMLLLQADRIRAEVDHR